MTYASSTLLAYEPCPNCGSRDNLARYSDGHGFCFGCGYFEASSNQIVFEKVPMTSNTINGLIPHGQPQALQKRRLSETTCAKWGYTISEYKGQKVQIANYRDITGKIIAQKLRFPSKEFKFLGDTKQAGLYGQHLWRDGGKRVTITEGEIDALSVSQAQNNTWAVVSLPTGAQGARRALKQAFEWLDNFEEIVLMFDNDEAGQKALENCASLQFKAGKLKVAKLPLKDASEMLQAGRGGEIVKAIFDAKSYRPDGIIAGHEMWEVLNTPDAGAALALPFTRLNDMTMGVRRGEVWTFTAGSGIGKSSIVREMAYHFIGLGETVGLIMLEENIKRTARGLVGLAIDAPAFLMWDELSTEDKKRGFDATLGTGRVYLYDHFGSIDIDNITSRIRFMAAACDCSLIVLDHLSIIVSGIDEGEERRKIDNIMTALKSLAMELNIAILLVSHLKRPSGDKGHEDGARTSLAQLRGSAGIAQLSDFVIGAERDQQAEQSNITTLRILKNRYTGETGVAGWLDYNPDTGRLTELVSSPFEKGDSYDYSNIEEAF